MDLARIGFSADTTDLVGAKQSLEALVPAAKRVERAADNMSSKLRQAAAGGLPGLPPATKQADSLTSALQRAAVGAGNSNTALLRTSTAMETVAGSVAAASGRMEILNAVVSRVGTNFVAADAHVAAYRASLAGVAPAAAAAASSLNRLGAAANDNINRLQSTPGNIAAQFQDIGVSAAGGMQPFLIALQQGTQLSAAMSGGIGNLFAGMRQLFSLTSIVTIALVGLAAAGLQNIDWMRLGQTLLNGLADGLDVLASVVEEASVALLFFSVVAAVAFGPAIISRIGVMAVAIGQSLVTALSTATLAMISFSLANPFGAIVIAIGLVIVAMIALNDAFGGIFTDILRVIKNVQNAMIRFFATGFNVIVTLAQNTANDIVSIFKGISGALGFDIAVGELDFSAIKVDLTPGRDFIGDVGAGIGSVVSDLAGRARGLAAGFLSGGDADAAATGGGTSRAASGKQTEAQRQADAHNELTKATLAQINALNVESRALGMSENAARLFRNEQELLAQATDKGIKLTIDQQNNLLDLAAVLSQAEIAVEIRKMTNAFQEQIDTLQQDAELIGLYGLELEFTRVRQGLVNDAVKAGIIDLDNMTDSMRAFVATLGDQAIAQAQLTENNRAAAFAEEFTQGLRQSTFELQRQAGELGLAGVALEAYRIESDLLAQEKRENLRLDPAVIEGIRAQALEYAMLNAQVQKSSDDLNVSRQALRGFFGDLVNNLQQGQSAWQAFGNAIQNVLNRVIDRLLDLAADEAFNSLSSAFGAGSSGTSGSGGGGGIFQAIGRLFANGGAFDGGVQKFANGGAFTNGTFDSPTMFKFGSGGTFGVMGEAGPEAVMPLKRGSDGSLGVQVQAVEPQMITIRVVTDDDRFDAYVDDRIGQRAPAVAEAGAVISNREQALLNSRTVRGRR